VSSARSIGKTFLISNLGKSSCKQGTTKDQE